MLNLRLPKEFTARRTALSHRPQIFEPDPFVDAAETMVAFAKGCVDTLGWAPQVLNLGGGFAVRYIEYHPHIDIEANVKAVCEAVTSSCAETGLPVPRILLEPGRSIVANAGVTLYTMGSVKHITGYKSYVSVDGGMTDNPRYALYSSPYTIIVANRAVEPPISVYRARPLLGKRRPAPLKASKFRRCERGDILAICCTSAYNYSMASNYNRIPRPHRCAFAKRRLCGGRARRTNSDIVKLDNIR